MSAASIFTIREILPGGDYGEEFIWTSDRTPASGQQGGARAGWVQPLGFGVQMRHVRTDYPGTKRPSRQVLGSTRKPLQLGGRFDDRYNYPGWAVLEVRRLEALCERGNLVEASHAEQSFIGLVTDVSFTYRKDWDISYSIALDLDRRKDEARPAVASPYTVEKPGQAVDDLTAIGDQIGEAHSQRPPGLLSATISGASSALLNLNESLASLQENVKATTGRGSTLGQFQQLAIRAQNVQGSAAAVALAFVVVRSDMETGIKTAEQTMRLDIWAKTMAYLARLSMARAIRARVGLAERQSPAIKRLYRPRKGQSLMEISREVYGTPYGHRAIAHANRLQTLYLTGEEILVIPER